MGSPEFGFGKKYEQASESQEKFEPFKMKLELSRSVISNNRNCMRCHSDNSREYQSRIGLGLTDAFKKIDKSRRVAK